MRRDRDCAGIRKGLRSLESKTRAHKGKDLHGSRGIALLQQAGIQLGRRALQFRLCAPVGDSLKVTEQQ